MTGDGGDALALDRVLGALPELPELAVLRDALLAASEPDPAHAWSSASRYVTFDKRVLAAGSLEGALRASRTAAHLRVDGLYDTAAALLAALARGDSAEVVDRLLELTGRLDGGGGDWSAAAAAARLAVKLASERRESALSARALRRLARVELAQGQLADAQRSYRQSAEHAAAASDTEAEANAWIGAGNACALQGAWPEARAFYQRALALTVRSDRQHAQVLINLAMIAHEEGALEEAQRCLDEARELEAAWSEADRSGWCNAAGLVQLSLGARERARSFFEEALHRAGTAFDRAMVLDNLGEEALRRGALEEAEAWARRAEAQALTGASPRALAEIYLRLGRIARVRSDANGVTFFEKALELCRARAFTVLEGTVYAEYGAFRAALGEFEEARSCVERARTIFERAGSLRAAAAAEATLRSLDGGRPTPGA